MKLCTGAVFCILGLAAGAREAVFQLAGTKMVRIAGSGNKRVNSSTNPLIFNVNYPNQLVADAAGDVYIGDSSVAALSNASVTGTPRLDPIAKAETSSTSSR